MARLALDSGVNEYSSHRANYYSRTVAHNTICVDEKSQAPAAGRMLHFSTENGVSCVQAECRTAYPGVLLRRTLVLAGDTLIDALDKARGVLPTDLLYRPPRILKLTGVIAHHRLP